VTLCHWKGSGAWSCSVTNRCGREIDDEPEAAALELALAQAAKRLTTELRQQADVGVTWNTRRR